MANRSYTQKTLKVLFGSSGNQCAHPECTNPVIVSGTEQSDNAVAGQICHIFAASDNGPRGKPDLTDEERNSPENLILLCGFHHPMVDTQYQEYPAEVLKQWKRDHEAKFQPATAEAMRRLEQVQQLAFTTKLTDQQIAAEARRIRQARHLTGYAGAEKARALAASIENNELAGGSSTVKAQALAWCARILSWKENRDRAKELLAKSRDLGGGPEADIASAFIVAAEAGTSAAALSQLAPMGTPESRSAMLRIVSNEKGPAGGLDWAQEAGLDFSSFDSDGKLNFIMNEELAGRWSEAYAHVQLLGPSDFDETPVLNYVAAQAYFARVIPEDLRRQTQFQVPFDAARFPMADDQQALQDRRRAIELYEKLATIAEEFGAVEAKQLSVEMALWLRLRDSEFHDRALEVLREQMNDDTIMLRRLPLALQFGLNVDLVAVERRINQRVALSGKGTPDEAVARLAIAMTKKNPAAIVEYIAAHRDQLFEFLDRSRLLCMEIELLCKSRQIETAKETLAQMEQVDIGELNYERLQRMIAEAEGADPAAERRRLYEKTGELRDLVDLVNFLEQEEAWQDLFPLAELLFDQTRSVEDAVRVARAFNYAGDSKRVLEFLKRVPDIVAQDDDLQALLAWALYQDGQFSEASKVLAPLRTKRDHVNDRALFVNLAIASGQWDLLVGYTTREWEQRGQRTAEELLRTVQLAQAVNAPHARDLILAATEAAPDNPHILASSYFHASRAGWEDDPTVSGWLLRAAETSGDQGPLKSVTMKELFELKPDWDRRQDQIYTALNAGKITVSGAANVLNQSMFQNCLLRPAANRLESDARRRSLVHAFSGARPAILQLRPDRIALDLTAIFTFAQLGLLPKLIAHFERVLIPDRLLVWLFQERQRVAFHQPSRIANARFLRRLLADGSLKIFSSQRQANANLAREVGFDLASMLEAAAQSTTDAYVVRSSPVHRLGNVMGEEADLKSYEACLCSCQAVIDVLRLKGMITAAEEQRALSYLSIHEKRWPAEPRIRDGAILYLDDLSTTYLRMAGVLNKLKGAGFKAHVTKSLEDQDNQLLTYESFAGEQLATIENIRSVLTSALATGRVETIASPDNDNEDAELQAQLNFLATDKPIDAFVVDDRFVNRYVHMDRGGQQTPILTSLDVVEYLVASGSLRVEEGREHRTTLRRSGYTFVPVREDELTHHLMQAPVDNGSLIETAELRAIRESAQLLQLAKVLQIPHELAWLNQYTIALIRAVRTVWATESDPATAEARCEWLLARLDIRGWASISEKGAARRFSVMSYAGVLHSLSCAPEITLKQKSQRYHRWIDERLIGEMKETEPEIFNQVISLATELLSESVKADAKEEA
ncbi:PIN domain-containing protein [Achromobacter xylosoxidans]